MILPLIKKFLRRQISKEVHRLAELEKSINERKNKIGASPLSPEKKLIEAQNEIAKKSLSGLVNYMVHVMPFIRTSIKHIQLGINSLNKNPTEPLNRINDTKLAKLEEKAIELGADKVAYTKLLPHYIFKDHSVMFDNLIVIIQEMDKDRIRMAPSAKTFKMIHQTYASLGVISSELTAYLRDEGFAAQAGSALNGMSVYPILAQNAGLGWIGKHGLLITPEFGPRQRITVIYTGIENLPFSDGRKGHSWVRDYCEKCNACAIKCPSKAILEVPSENTPYNTSHIDAEKCFPEFYDNYACTVCIKVCPFSKKNYHDLKAKFVSKYN
jgi:epoxyqueuosine reductase